MSDTISHLWVARSENFSPSLLVVDRLEEEERPPQTHEKIELTLFDLNGRQSGNASFEYPYGGAGYLSLEPFLSALPVEQGLQYGHLVVRSETKAKHMLRWKGEGLTDLTNPPLQVKPREPQFFPLYLNDSRDHILVIVNPTSEVVNYTIRLFAGQRSPEITLELAPMASKVFSVVHEFWSKLRDIDSEGALQSYVRVSINQTGCLGVQLLETLSTDRLRFIS